MRGHEQGQRSPVHAECGQRAGPATLQQRHDHALREYWHYSALAVNEAISFEQRRVWHDFARSAWASVHLGQKALDYAKEQARLLEDPEKRRGLYDMFGLPPQFATAGFPLGSDTGGSPTLTRFMPILIFLHLLERDTDLGGEPLLATAILFFTKGAKTDRIWFYDMEHDGFSLDDKRQRVPENDIPDVLKCWQRRRCNAAHT